MKKFVAICLLAMVLSGCSGLGINDFRANHY